MATKLFAAFCAVVLAFSLSTAAQAYKDTDTNTAANAGKKARWEGVVIRTNKDQSTITVRKANSSVEREIHYDNSTKFTAQEHGSKKVENIDPTQIKEEDRVICLGTYDKNRFNASLISKRLSHSPK